MLKLEPLIVCFYISEVLPYSIKAVDHLVLETQRKLMVEIFIWTRCNILYPSESCESSAMAFDDGPPKGPVLLWDGIIRSTLPNHPAVAADSLPSRGIEAVQQPCVVQPCCIHTTRSQQNCCAWTTRWWHVTAEHSFCLCGGTLSCSPGQLFSEGGKNLVAELWNHL